MQLPSHSTFRPTRPLLIWDGQCGFCKYWAIRWRHLTGSSVRYAPYQRVHYLIDEIAKQEFAKAVRLIETDGKIYSGAHAAYKTLQYTNKWNFLLAWYKNHRWFKKASDLGYRFISKNRPALYRLTVTFCGKNPHSPTPYWIFYLATLLFIVAWALD